MAKPKVAIVCDWLMGTGGAERVVLELHRMFPKAPIYTSQYDKNPEVWFGDKWFENADIRTGWLQSLPVAMRKALPILRAWYFSHLDLSEYDLVISSSGAEAKAVRAKNGLHINYCHAPTHYYWNRYDEYLQNPGFGLLNPLARWGLILLAGPMRRWDRKASRRPDHMIANSNYTKKQIKKYYGRDSEVIHPPVDVERFKTLNKSSNHRHGFVTAGRQTPYKRIDLAVRACSRLNVPLTVLGKGPDHRRLKRIAGKSVTFLRGKSDEEVADHFRKAQAFIFPGVDDFGIVAVEAMAAGTPVIAYEAGGALDYVEPGKTGLFFVEQTVESLEAVLKKFKPESFNDQAIQKSSARFSASNFRLNVDKFIKTRIISK